MKRQVGGAALGAAPAPLWSGPAALSGPAVASGRSAKTDVYLSDTGHLQARTF